MSEENFFLLIAIVFPVLVYSVDKRWKRRFEGDEDFAGADIHLCGFTVLFAVVLHCTLADKFNGLQAAWNWSLVFVNLLCWNYTLQIASAKTASSRRRSSALGGLFFGGSLLWIGQLRVLEFLWTKGGETMMERVVIYVLALALSVGLVVLFEWYDSRCKARDEDKSALSWDEEQ